MLVIMPESAPAVDEEGGDDDLAAGAASKQRKPQTKAELQVPASPCAGPPRALAVTPARPHVRALFVFVGPVRVLPPLHVQARAAPCVPMSPSSPPYAHAGRVRGARATQ